jgi:hypothetical protein
MTTSKEELLAADKILHPIFYEELLMSGFPRLWARLMVTGKSPVPQRVALAWYGNQMIVQLFKPLKKPQRIYHIQTTQPLRVVFLDTMFIDDWSIVCVMDLFSKFASVTAFRKAIDSKSTTKALQQFLDAVGADVKDIGEFRVDGGTEYMGAFQKFVGDEKRIVSMAYRKQQMSPVERFNGTLRRFLERMFEVRQKPINWPQLYIPEAVRVYNEELEHAATGYTPKEAFSNKEAQRIIRRAQVQTYPPPEVSVGDTVRIVSRDVQNLFDRKIRSNWTRELYEVKSVKGSTITLLTQKDDDIEVMSHEVMKIDPDLLFEGPKKIVTEAKPRPKPSVRREQRQLEDYLTAPEATAGPLPEKRTRKAKPIHDV